MLENPITPITIIVYVKVINYNLPDTLGMCDCFDATACILVKNKQ